MDEPREEKMRQFEHPNMNGFLCPICKTAADAPVVLVGIPGTEEDGIIECDQVHSECYKVYAKMHGVEITIET
jgi:hypothetical protein